MGRLTICELPDEHHKRWMLACFGWFGALHFACSAAATEQRCASLLFLLRLESRLVFLGFAVWTGESRSDGLVEQRNLVTQTVSVPPEPHNLSIKVSITMLCKLRGGSSDDGAGRTRRAVVLITKWKSTTAPMIFKQKQSVLWMPGPSGNPGRGLVVSRGRPPSSVPWSTSTSLSARMFYEFS